MTRVNFAVIIILMVQLTLSWPGSWFIDKAGLHWGVMVCSLAVAIGACVKCLVNVHFDFYVLGQGIVAISFSLNTTCQTKLAQVWFGPEERALALGFLQASTLFGCLIGSTIPFFFMKEIDAYKNPELFKQRIFDIMAMKAILAIAALFLNICIHKEKPDIAPSPSAE